MRHNAPIWWCDQPVGKGGFNDGGFWVVTKHKDVKEVSLPDPTALAKPERIRSGWLNGIKRWQVDYTGECPVAH